MTCRKCGNVAIGGMSLCRACLRKRSRESKQRSNPAIAAGFAHAGTEITPVKEEIKEIYRRWHAQKNQPIVETQAEKIAAIQERVKKNFFEEAAEELAQEVNRPKWGIQPIPTCECGRKLIDGECYKCRR